MSTSSIYGYVLALCALLGSLLALYVFKRDAPPPVPTINVFMPEGGIKCVTATHKGAIALTCDFGAKPAPLPKRESQHAI